MNEVSISRIVGDKLRIELKSGREYRIMTDALTLKELEKINLLFKSYLS